jgi:hypothetical protein
VDASRVSTGDVIAAAGGLVLFVSLLLDWYGDANAWQVFNVIDVLLAVIALLAIGLVVIRLAGDQGLRFAAERLVLVCGLIAVVVTLAFLAEGSDRRIGAFLSVLGAAAIAFGAHTSIEERSESSSGDSRRGRPRG